MRECSFRKRNSTFFMTRLLRQHFQSLSSNQAHLSLDGHPWGFVGAKSCIHARTGWHRRKTTCAGVFFLKGSQPTDGTERSRIRTNRTEETDGFGTWRNFNLSSKQHQLTHTHTHTHTHTRKRKHTITPGRNIQV